MAQINDDYLKLPGSYLFADIAHKVNAFKENHPEMALIRLGIGDVTRPLPPSVIKALHKAVDEQATAEGFRGYGPEQGYRFLRVAIAQGDFASRGVEIDPDDIFVSDGAKCDLRNFQEMFARGNVIALTAVPASEAARRHLPVPAEQSHRHGPEPPRAAALG